MLHNEIKYNPMLKILFQQPGLHGFQEVQKHTLSYENRRPCLKGQGKDDKPQKSYCWENYPVPYKVARIISLTLTQHLYIRVVVV